MPVETKKKNDPRTMTVDELLLAAEKMPEHIRTWFDERVAILEVDAGFATEDAVRTAYILARAEYKARQENVKRVDQALALIAEAGAAFKATCGRFTIEGEPSANGTVVRVALTSGEVAP